MTDTLVLVWSGTSFTSSSTSSSGGSRHLVGTNMTVDWGDGTTGTITSGQRFTHTYSNNGTYTIIITGDSITELGAYCFRNCTGLKKIIIPSSVTMLNNYALNGCSGLQQLVFTGNTRPIMMSTSCYSSVPTTCKIYIPNSTYKSATNYPSSSTYTYIEQNTTEMAKAAIIARGIFNKLYPVGAIYMTTENINPAEKFGGAWEQIKDRFLLGCGSYSNGSTGGSADAVNVTHTHAFTEGGNSINVDTSTAATKSGLTSGGYWNNEKKKLSSIASTGVSGTGKNMPPYLVVNIWRRLV